MHLHTFNRVRVYEIYLHRACKIFVVFQQNTELIRPNRTESHFRMKVYSANKSAFSLFFRLIPLKKRKSKESSGKKSTLRLERQRHSTFLEPFDQNAWFFASLSLFAEKCLNARNVLYQSLISCWVLNEIRTGRLLDGYRLCTHALNLTNVFDFHTRADRKSIRIPFSHHFTQLLISQHTKRTPYHFNGPSLAEIMPDTISTEKT